MFVTELPQEMVDSRRQHRGVGSTVILPAEQFHGVLQHERLRSDRSQLPFCMIAMDFGVEPSDFPSVALEAIQHRVRVTDEIGWLFDGRLGVITPYTSGHGAQMLAQDLVSLSGASALEPEIEIYEYSPTAIPRRENDGEPAESESAELVNSSLVQSGNVEELLIRTLPLWKRSIDLLGASVGLIVLAPLFVLVPLLIKLFSPGPVFFVQRRSGLAGKPFRMLKFRTMIVDAQRQRRRLMQFNEQDGPAFKIGNDPRVTSIGHWLRRLSIDELPQLWNVLKGDMSLVGPRPLPCAESEACHSWQRRRLTVTPGMTCTWQIQNRTTTVPFEQWMRMDVHYADSRCFKMDLQLIAKTFLFIVGLRGR
jgi:lipopolysaccharide/colanic/teichoic acid biosynthesis glycosyltransferase